jgi:hypothetical protein
MTDKDDRPIRCDANIQQLFDWSKTCPKEWKFHWHISEEGRVYMQFMKSNVKPVEKNDDEELTDSQKLDLARGRPVRDGS